jgi:hypothetical protein
MSGRSSAAATGVRFRPAAFPRLAEGRVTITEDARGRDYIGVAGLRGGLFSALPPVRADVGGIGIGRPGEVWLTAGDRILRLDADHAGAGRDLTGEFGGPPSGERQVFGGRDGSIWVEGCLRWRTAVGVCTNVPGGAVPGRAPIPRVIDQHGNFWSIAPRGADPARPEVLLLAAPAYAEWTVCTPTPGPTAENWEQIAADDFGFVWLASRVEIRRLDPREPQLGWAPIPRPAGMSAAAITALGRSVPGRMLVGLADGTLYELDVIDGRPQAWRQSSAGLPARPIRAVAAKRDGSLLVVAGSRVYRRPPQVGDWPGPWRNLARLPYGIHDVYPAVLDGKVYVPGGLANHGFPATQQLFDELLVYDPATASWSVAARLSSHRAYPGVAVLEGRLWLVGGDTGGRRGSDQVEIYDPRTGRIERGPSLQVKRTESMVHTVNGRIYAICGADEKGGVIGAIESIGPGETAWRIEAPAPFPLRETTGCVVGNQVYICVPEHGLVRYDPATGAWDTKLPPMPKKAPWGNMTVHHNGEIWVMGGWSSTNPRETYCYSLASQSWRLGPLLPTELSWGAACDWNGHIFIAGGAYGSRPHHALVFSDAAYLLSREAVEP